MRALQARMQEDGLLLPAAAHIPPVVRGRVELLFGCVDHCQAGSRPRIHDPRLQPVLEEFNGCANGKQQQAGQYEVS